MLNQTKQVSARFIAITSLTSLALVACSVKPITTEDEAQPQRIDIGVLTTNSEVAAQGTMAEWNNAVAGYPLKEQWKYGIDFAFDLNLDQAVHLFLDSDQNFDCNFGGTLMGPSYYIQLADGKELALDYESRSNVKVFAGTGDYDFPGVMPAGSHKLIARWFSNEECRMDVSVAAKDRFAPEHNYGPSIQRADLFGTWTKEDTTYAYGMSGLLTVTNGNNNAVVEITDFPYLTRYTSKVQSVTGAMPGFNVGDVTYCLYEIDTDVSPSTLEISCNAVGNTGTPTASSSPLVLTK
jgi:hypothetical protein